MDIFEEFTTNKSEPKTTQIENPNVCISQGSFPHNSISIKNLQQILETNPHIKQNAIPVSKDMLKNLKRSSTEPTSNCNAKRLKTDTNKFQQHKPSRFFTMPLSKDYDFENREFAELIHNDAYTNYEPAKLKLGKSHPYTVVESRSLMSAEVPDIKYQLKMPVEIIDQGCLSNVQLEAVVYACQKHEEDFHDDKRLGFLIGDGAGVGKGRTIAGIILENYLSGRKKSIWVSVSSDLKQDAERDIGDIGNPIGVQIKVAALSKMSYNKINTKENRNFEEGVLFVSYSSLIGKCKNLEKNQFKKRIDQIIDWFGEDYDGVIVFDECHKAKNLHHNKKTKTGSVVKRLQDKLKSARVVYASATGASEPKHMAYMVRLGLWGPGKRFFDFEEFESTLTSLGVGAMELIAIEMKTKGIYLARQLSFQGVKFEVQELPIENSTINGHKFKDVYNKCVKVWINIYEEFTKAFQRNKLDEKEENIFEAQYWSAHQRFFKYLCIAGKIQECVKITKNKIKRGNKCVVIGLQSTGEAQTMDMLDESTTEVFEFVSSAKRVIKNLIENHYPSTKNLQKNRLKAKSKHNSKCFDVMMTPYSVINNIDDEDDDDIIFLGDEGIDNIKKTDNSSFDDAIKQNMLKTIDDIDTMFPINALDQLIHELGGPKLVAEMTGRKGRILESKGSISYQPRKEAETALDQINLLEKERFNNGIKPIAIISDAASTGISLHSDVRFKNKKQRYHITIELPWSADKAIQQFGRTHRSNQVISPHYIFLISDLAGERRFVSTIAKRLESLGALTHGDRRCASNKDFGQFNFDNGLGLKAVYHLIQSIQNPKNSFVPFPSKHLNFCGNDDDKFCQLAMDSLKNVGLNEKNITVTKFLNRLLGIDIDLQNALFQYFLDIIEDESLKAKSRQEFDYGIRDIMNEENTVYLEETNIFNEISKNDEEIIKMHKIINVDDGVSWEKANQRYSLNPQKNIFCVSNNFEHLFLALAEYKSPNEFVLITPNFPEKSISKELLDSMWQKCESFEIQRDWEYVHRESRTRCLHDICNETCPKRFCMYGQRMKTSYIITGAVFSAFKLIAPVIRKCMISRVDLHDGRKLIGAMVSPSYYQAVMNCLEEKYSDQRCDRFEAPDELLHDMLSYPSPALSSTSKTSLGKKSARNQNVNESLRKSNTERKKKGLPLLGISVDRINDVVNREFKKPDKFQKIYNLIPNNPKPLSKERKVAVLPITNFTTNFTVEFETYPKK